MWVTLAVLIGFFLKKVRDDYFEESNKQAQRDKRIGVAAGIGGTDGASAQYRHRIGPELPQLLDVESGQRRSGSPTNSNSPRQGSRTFHGRRGANNLRVEVPPTPGARGSHISGSAPSPLAVTGAVLMGGEQIHTPGATRQMSRGLSGSRLNSDAGSNLG